MPKKPETYSALASDEERNAPLVAGSPWVPMQAQQKAASKPLLPGQPENVSAEDFAAGLARQAEADKNIGPLQQAPIDPQTGLEFRHQFEKAQPGKKYKKDIGYGYR